MMESSESHLLVKLESWLRTLLPAKLYALAWVDPSPETLMAVFEHLRTLQHILYGYLPRQVTERPPRIGETRYGWQEGTLMFTDLAGFTPLMEAYSSHGREGANTVWNILNGYFAQMLDIISRSGGNLLEFTGDAMLVQFPKKRRQNDTAQAIRAGLRMQRAMASLANIDTPKGERSLGMRVGIHPGRFLEADIGTPLRMQHVLLGKAVRTAKKAEGAGQVGRVCLTEEACARLDETLRCEPYSEGYALIVDDLSDGELGEYEIAFTKRRATGTLLLDRSAEGLLTAIEQLIDQIEPLASFLPLSVLNLLVENAAQRQIPPDFPTPAVIFINLLGLPEALDQAPSGEEENVVARFSHAFALINAAVEKRGGVLSRITYHLEGSDTVICFGTPNAHTNDPFRAAETMLDIRDIVTSLPPLSIGGQDIQMTCQIGMSYGSIFTGELGEPRGRRELTIQGDIVNTAARLMSRATENQILCTEAMYREIEPHFVCESLGTASLKGKTEPVPIYALLSAKT
jgi:class 3 adenylate cyclase